MKKAANTADLYADSCWSICCKEIENLSNCYNKKQKLHSAVTNFARWLNTLE